MIRKFLLAILGGFLLSGVALAQPGGTVDIIAGGDFNAGTPLAPIGAPWTNPAGVPFAIYGVTGNSAALATSGGTTATISQTVNIGATGPSQIIIDFLSAASGTLDFFVNGNLEWSIPSTQVPVVGLMSPIFDPGVTGPVTFEIRNTFAGNSGLWEFDNVAYFAQPAPPPPGGGVPEINASASALPIAIVFCFGLMLADRRRRVPV
jgi:hypothetical protein